MSRDVNCLSSFCRSKNVVSWPVTPKTYSYLFYTLLFSLVYMPETTSLFPMRQGEREFYWHFDILSLKKNESHTSHTNVYHTAPYQQSKQIKPLTTNQPRRRRRCSHFGKDSVIRMRKSDTIYSTNRHNISITKLEHQFYQQM